jgi:PAS domain S-box-containing protein
MISVLYVDDETPFLELTKLYLEKTAGLTVDTADSAETALEKMEKTIYDVIVSDYQMQGMDGIEFLKTIRASGNFTPFIIFTGKGREEVVIQAFESGADFYLQKGGDPKPQFTELERKITRAVELHRAETNRKESEQRLREIIDFLPDATFAIDIEGRVIAWNRAIEEMTGMPAASMMGKGDYEYAIPFYGTRRPVLIDLIFEPDEIITRDYANIIHEKNVLIADTSLPCPKGRPATLMGKASPLYNLQGQIAGAIESIRDITELTRSEDELRAAYGQLAASEEELRANYKILAEKEQRNRILLDNASDAVFVHEMKKDGSGKFLDFNKKACELTGYTREELLQLGPYDLDTTEQRKRSPELARHILDTKHATFQTSLVSKSGQEIPVEISATIFDLNGNPTNLSFVRDITERKRAEETLQESEERHRAVIEDQTEFICRFLPDGTHVFVNEAYARYFGKTRDDLIGTVFRPIIFPDDRENFRQFFSSLTPAHPIDYIVHRVIMPDGEVRWLRWSDRAIFDETGSIIEYQSVGCDITEQKRAEEALQESESRFRALVENLSDFISILDHEGQIVFSTPASERMLGHPLGNNPFEYIHPDDLENVKHALSLVYADTNPGTPTEFRIRKADGTYTWVESIGKNLIGIPGIDGVVITSRFIDERKQAEVATKQSEEKFRTLLENVPDLVLVHRNGKILYVNPSMIHPMGYRPEEVIDKPILDFIVPEYHEQVAAVIGKRMTARPPGHYEIELLAKNGEHRRVIVRGAVIDYGGSPAILNVLTDITDSKRIEETLRKSEAQLQAILQGSPIPKFVIDRDHRVISWNRALEETTGIRAEEILGTTRHWQAFYDHERPCLADLLLEGEINRIPELYGVKCHKSAIVEEGYEGTDFFPRLGKTGKWLAFVAAQIRDPDGTVMGAVETLEDITPLKDSEQSLRASEQRYYNIIEDQTEFICRFLPDGTHVFVNDAYARYFAKTREEMIGKIFRPNIHPEDRKMVGQFFTTLTPEHPVDFIEQRIIMPDGGVRWQRWSDRAIFDDAGSLIEYQSVGRDTTMQKQADEALLQANRQLKLLTSITRHDILNKVTVVLGYLPLAREKSSDPTVVNYLTKLESVTKDIQDQIEFTRIYQDLGGQEPQWQKLKDVVARQQFPGTITLSIDAKEVWVFADPLFEKVFFNLLDNSVRHGRNATTIRVYSQETDGGLTIAWEDNGVGIPLAEKERVFERGYGKNTGLGLFLVREILAITGMTIIETGEPGKGALFEIAVPKGMYRAGP